VLARGAQQNRTLIVTGYPGELTVVEMGGRSYVDLEALARLANGSLSFRGNQIVLTWPTSAASTSRTASPAGQPVASGFSKDFLTAAIEQMSVIREWRSALVGAVQRGYPVTADWMASFSGRAQSNLRLVSVALSTESDRNAFVLLTNEFNNMKKLSDRFVAANKSRSYTPTNSLDDDPLDRKIVNCGHSLAAMAASDQFVDDGSCR